jgi:hypothetical protein
LLVEKFFLVNHVTCAYVSRLNVIVQRTIRFKDAIWHRGLERWYLVLGGVAICHGFELESDMELFSAKIINTENIDMSLTAMKSEGNG